MRARAVSKMPSVSTRSWGRVEQALQAAGGGVGEAQQERPAAGAGEPPRWRLAADLGAVAVGDDEAAVLRQQAGVEAGGHAEIEPVAPGQVVPPFAVAWTNSSPSSLEPVNP